jgi:predicted DNA-binding transcriptional regulator YafY
MDHRSESRQRITEERASRLYHMIVEMDAGPQQRTGLMRRLKVGVRTFFRDLDLLRECGIDVEASENGYILNMTEDEALSRLPFPDPELSFGDIVQLMRGRSQVHRRLKKLFDRATT